MTQHVYVAATTMPGEFLIGASEGPPSQAAGRGYLELRNPAYLLFEEGRLTLQPVECMSVMHVNLAYCTSFGVADTVTCECYETWWRLRQNPPTFEVEDFDSDEP